MRISLVLFLLVIWIIKFYQNIIDVCVFATNDAIPCRNLFRLQDKHKHFPGWTPELNLAREQLLFWHFIWDACDRPREGEVVDVMRHTRNHYHYLIRRIKKNNDLTAWHSLSCVTPNETIGLK